jgi:hypothetical protein
MAYGAPDRIEVPDSQGHVSIRAFASWLFSIGNARDKDERRDASSTSLRGDDSYWITAAGIYAGL